ncbi:MAG: porin family protein [Methylacidiphilales bacterium]|nr:porin family protein [Candidatus Methylacidiphilales bacterium]
MKLTFLSSMILLMGASLLAYAGTDMKEMAITPTLRTDSGFYAGVYGGAQFDTDYGNQRQTLSGTPASAGAVGVPAGSNIIPSSHFDAGWGGAGGIKFGYTFNSFGACQGLRLQPALEAEALYLGTTSTDTLNAVGLTGSGKQSYNSAAWFVNGILRFKLDSMITPYVGVGVGGQYLTLHSDATIPSLGAHVTGINGSDVDFAGQALAGFDINLATHWDLFTEYKFIDAVGTDLKVSNVGGTGLDYRYKPDQIQQHLIVAGVKYNF